MHNALCFMNSYLNEVGSRKELASLITNHEPNRTRRLYTGKGTTKKSSFQELKFTLGIVDNLLKKLLYVQPYFY